MRTRDRLHGSVAVLALGLVLGLGACGGEPARWLQDLRARVTGTEPAQAVPAPAPGATSAAPSATAPAPANGPPDAAPRGGDGPRLDLTGERKFAGGRPLPWWSERLARLRRDGPEDLYRLTLARARLSGLEVAEEPGGPVAVRAAARAEARP